MRSSGCNQRCGIADDRPFDMMCRHAWDPTRGSVLYTLALRRLASRRAANPHSCTCVAAAHAYCARASAAARCKHGRRVNRERREVRCEAATATYKCVCVTCHMCLLALVPEIAECCVKFRSVLLRCQCTWICGCGLSSDFQLSCFEWWTFALGLLPSSVIPMMTHSE